MAHAREPNDRRLDATTVVAAKLGEPWAARQLVEATQSAVFRYAWRMLGPRANQATAAELVQEVYARAFRSLPRYQVDGAARFETWLLTITHRTVVDELRRKRPIVTMLDDPHAGPADERPDRRPDRLHDRKWLGERIARAVQDLSPPMRSAFILRTYHDLSLTEIAEALDIDEGTVKSRLHRARRALKVALQELSHAD